MTDNWADKAIDDVKTSYEAETAELRTRIATLETALVTIARGQSVIFSTNPQVMSGNEAAGIASAALADKGGGE